MHRSLTQSSHISVDVIISFTSTVEYFELQFFFFFQEDVCNTYTEPLQYIWRTHTKTYTGRHMYICIYTKQLQVIDTTKAVHKNWLFWAKTSAKNETKEITKENQTAV